jgi:hypothetical protein
MSASQPRTWRLKYCTARSCASAAFRERNVPRLRRFPVLGFFLCEYKRYCPDFSFLIIPIPAFDLTIFATSYVGESWVWGPGGVDRSSEERELPRAMTAFLEVERRATKGGFQAGQTAKARRGPPCAVTPR